jgi:hypothetical protein
MKLPDMNNVYVTHKGREISISDHRNMGDRYDITFYGRSLDSLINRLIEVRDEINKGEQS